MRGQRVAEEDGIAGGVGLVNLIELSLVLRRRPADEVVVIVTIYFPWREGALAGGVVTRGERVVRRGGAWLPVHLVRVSVKGEEERVGEEVGERGDLFGGRPGGRVPPEELDRSGGLGGGGGKGEEKVVVLRVRVVVKGCRGRGIIIIQVDYEEGGGVVFRHGFRRDEQLLHRCGAVALLKKSISLP